MTFVAISALRVKRKQKVQNKLYMNAIKIWDVAYKGQLLGHCLPTFGR